MRGKDEEREEKNNAGRTRISSEYMSQHGMLCGVAPEKLPGHYHHTALKSVKDSLLLCHSVCVEGQGTGNQTQGLYARHVLYLEKHSLSHTKLVFIS